MQPGSCRHKPQHKQTSCHLCRNLGTQVFSRPLVQKDQVESWRESLYRVYKSGQQSMRVAVYGTKHDASLFEELLKEASQFEPLGTIGDTMIDTACLNIPKVRTRGQCTPSCNHNRRHHGCHCLPPTSLQVKRVGMLLDLDDSAITRHDASAYQEILNSEPLGTVMRHHG